MRGPAHHIDLNASVLAASNPGDALLVEDGVPALGRPADYPGYRPGCCAVFFAESDGIKLVHAPDAA